MRSLPVALTRARPRRRGGVHPNHTDRVQPDPLAGARLGGATGRRPGISKHAHLDSGFGPGISPGRIAQGESRRTADDGPRAPAATASRAR